MKDNATEDATTMAVSVTVSYETPSLSPSLPYKDHIPYKDRNRQAAKERWQSFVDAGWCGACGVCRRVTATRCMACLIDHRLAMRAKRRSAIHQRRTLVGEQTGTSPVIVEQHLVIEQHPIIKEEMSLIQKVRDAPDDGRAPPEYMGHGSARANVERQLEAWKKRAIDAETKVEKFLKEIRRLNAKCDRLDRVISDATLKNRNGVGFRPGANGFTGEPKPELMPPKDDFPRKPQPIVETADELAATSLLTTEVANPAAPLNGK